MSIAKGATRKQQEERIEELVAALSLEEKVAMLSGHGFMKQVAGGRYCSTLYHIGAGNERLDVPPLLFNDGPRGVSKGESTCFPVPMARGASFDTELEERVGDAIGREMRAHGGNLFGGVCINLLRHPAWGRAQETYGEDPFLVGEMGAALTRGVQRHNVVATPKHFAANSMENARFVVDVGIDERALREVYLPHFKRCIDAGAGAVMSAYNQVNGAYCGHNEMLLTDILKGDWGFDGFVYSDFVLGCRGWDAFPAGLDVEAPDTHHYGAHLQDAAERGDVTPERLDDGVRRVLRSLFRMLAAHDPETYSEDQIACSAHVALAREAAEKSIVLLKNDDVLPWDPVVTKQLLVVGPLADAENLGDHGSSRVYPPHAVSALAALREACPQAWTITHDEGVDLDRVATLASQADHVLVVAGYTHLDEGEFIPAPMADPKDPTLTIGGDRIDLTLGAEQETLIQTVAGANPRSVVAVMAGSSVIVEAWRNQVAGILMLWYPGMEGGHALTDVLFGRVNPSGHLPFSVPKRPEDLPYFDRDAKAIRYDLWHGYTKLEQEGIEPAFPFGFGLSYSSFEYTNPSACQIDGGSTIRVEVDITNQGERGGDVVAQVYAGWREASPEQPLKRLCGFRRVPLSAGETRRVAVDIATSDLAWFDAREGCWRLGAEDWRIQIGSSSARDGSAETSAKLPEATWSVSER